MIQGGYRQQVGPSRELTLGHARVLWGQTENKLVLLSYAPYFTPNKRFTTSRKPSAQSPSTPLGIVSKSVSINGSRLPFFATRASILAQISLLETVRPPSIIILFSLATSELSR